MKNSGSSRLETSDVRSVVWLQRSVLVCKVLTVHKEGRSLHQSVKQIQHKAHVYKIFVKYLK